MAGTIHFDRKCTPTADYVVLRVIDRHDKFNAGGILIPESVYANDKLGFYQVVEAGENAWKEYGLAKGDYVCCDRLAQVYPTAPICVMKYVNVICRTNETNDTFSPLKNMVFVKDDTETVQNIGGVLRANYTKKLLMGEVVAMDVDEEVPYKVGDRVMLSKGGDSFSVGNQHVFIYKKDMIVCRVDEA